MTITLVDRYVYTALRRVPEQQRADIDRELRGSIDDAVDARVEAGESREAAIERTLLELGDPDRLADSYAGRRNVLIGPELYGVWRRLMVTLFSTVLPLVVVAVAVVELFNDDVTVGSVIAAIVTTAITVSVHMAFWTTGVFAVIERTGLGQADLKRAWTLDDLPKYEPGALSRIDFGATLVWPVLVIAALVLQQFTFTDEPLLDPANWSFWWPTLIVLIALKCVWAVWVYRLGRWTRPAAVANAALSVVTAALMIYLLTADRFFNPAFTGFDGADVDLEGWVSLATIVAVALGALYDIVDVARKAELARKGLPARIPGTGNTYSVS
ncbi:permease prefix domain 1-containing protein [Paractinoplanes hotanensis]|uniref:Permease prefix domain 1-containing protein n=1 Tax=Paractinoplanes hotanensis TaxID=2906497 RepID=A0ABT0XZL2_9ACTN|nr:permease prefix domain 1-containing protein [Actinoplanes hotanensis]MCM4079228.1 permease prefix domain 1-containing protein [Actinoplanes hotanensis]